MKRGGKIEALPAWARGLIERLEATVERQRAEIEKVGDAPKDSAVQVLQSARGVAFGMDPYYTTVRFKIGRATTPHGARWWVDVRLDGERLLVQGSASIKVEPSSSNVVTIDMLDRHEVNEDSQKRDLGERLLDELLARGMDWQDGLNLIADCDPEAVKATRHHRRELSGRRTRY